MILSGTPPSPFLFLQRQELAFSYGERTLCKWACSSARLERTPDKREVGSSSLPRPTTYQGLGPNRFQSGAIAQLGERLLCKQEVVGSIPSGSTNSRDALAESQFSVGGSPPPRGHLLHREEGIDLSLSRAARPQGLAERFAYPGQRSQPPRCWVSLDENLVLTSVPPFWRYRPLAYLCAFASRWLVAVSKKKQALILRKQYSASTHLSSDGY